MQTGEVNGGHLNLILDKQVFAGDLERPPLDLYFTHTYVTTLVECPFPLSLYPFSDYTFDTTMDRHRMLC